MPEMDDTQTLHAAVAALHKLATQLGTSSLVWRPSYEYSPVYSVGGVTGTYTLDNYFATASEYRVLGASFTDAGTLAVGPASDVAAPASTDKLDPSLRRASMVLTGTANSYASVSECWQTLAPASSLTIVTNVTNSHAAFVLIQFRRRINQAGRIAE